MIPANMTLEVSELFTRELTRVCNLILLFLSIACYTKGYYYMTVVSSILLFGLKRSHGINYGRRTVIYLMCLCVHTDMINESI